MQQAGSFSCRQPSGSQRWKQNGRAMATSLELHHAGGYRGWRAVEPVPRSRPRRHRPSDGQQAVKAAVAT